jgi:hypothetical protein
MPEKAAQDRASGRPLSMSAYSVVERGGLELPVTGKWPRAWRLLFLAGAAMLAWAGIALLTRWI